MISAPLRVLPSDRIAELERESATLRECLEIAMRSLAFERSPTSLADLRLIRDKLRSAGVEVLA